MPGLGGLLRGVPGLGGRGVSAPGGAWSGRSAPEGLPGGDPPGRLLLRAVRILLECILSLQVFKVIEAPCL